MADPCVLLTCADGTTNLLHVASRSLLTSYRENNPTLRGVVAPASPHALHDGAHGGEAFLVCQAGRPAIHVWAWGRDVPVFKCALAEPIACLAVSPDGAFAFGGSPSGKLYVWDLPSGELLRVLQAHYKAVTAVSSSACGQYIATGSQDALVHAWDVASLVDAAGCADPGASTRPVVTWSGHSLPVTALQFSTRGGTPRVLSASLDRTVRAWDLACRAAVYSFALPSAVAAIATDLDETRLFVGCIDSVVYCVDTSAAAVHAANESGAYVVSGGGTAGSGAGAVASGGSPVSTLRGHTSTINALAVCHDGLQVISASDDGTARVWDARSGACLSTLVPASTTGGPSRSPILALHVLPRKPAAFMRAAVAAGGRARSEGAAASSAAASSSLFVGPLRKHVAPISSDWRGSSTGPTDRDAILPLAARSGEATGSLGLVAGGAQLEPSAGADAALRDGLRAMEAGLMAIAHGPREGAGAGAGSGGGEEGEVSALRERVRVLEEEALRWKALNNKLAARVKS
jgi:pre-rRNA-processing protein IPI3